jgi:hypothetical protein
LLRRVKRPTGVGVTNALASPQYISNLQSGCIEEYVKVVASPRISLFVARGNAPKPFHLTEEIFDEMTPCVFVLVMRGMPVGSLAKRDDSLNVSTRQAVAQPTCVERLVADEGQAIDAGHKSIEACDVVAMARQQHEADQIAERIYDGRDLRRPTAARFANGLFLSPPFAPVPC